MLDTGATLPEVRLADDAGAPLSTAQYFGSSLVLCFYPKADTPGCTDAATQFRDPCEGFERKGTRSVGIGRATVAAHEKRTAKYRCNESIGVQRATLAFDAAGRVAQLWPKLAVDGYAGDVLSKI